MSTLNIKNYLKVKKNLKLLLEKSKVVISGGLKATSFTVESVKVLTVQLIAAVFVCKFKKLVSAEADEMNA